MTQSVLITSVGSLVGQALIEALSSRRPGLRLIGCNLRPEAASLFACDKAFLTPATADAEAFRAALAEILRSERPDLVIPARDEELAVLAGLARVSEFAGCRFLVPPLQLVPVFNDKYASFCFARSHGLPFAETARTDGDSASLARLLARCGFPLVAKPGVGGHASQGVRLVQNTEQLERLRTRAGLVVQELLNPATLELPAVDLDAGLPWVYAIQDEKAVAEVVLGRAGEIVSLSCCRMFGGETGGKIWYALEQPRIEAVARAYAEVLGAEGLRGPFNLQGKLQADGSFSVYELNGRFTGSAAARAALGYNQVLHACRHYLDGEGLFAPHRPARPAAAIKQPQNYLALDAVAMERLGRDGVWEP